MNFAAETALASPGAVAGTQLAAPRTNTGSAGLAAPDALASAATRAEDAFVALEGQVKRQPAQPHHHTGDDQGRPGAKDFAEGHDDSQYAKFNGCEKVEARA